MAKKPKITALITASGRGSRLNNGEGIPKQYLKIANMPILRYTILTFLNNPNIDDIICVIHPDDIDFYQEAVLGLDILDPVYGGQTRQESTLNGLNFLEEQNKPDLILIHDAVRPFVSKKIIDGIIDKLQTHPAVIPAVAVEDTIKKISDGKIQWTLERENLWRAQTPQGFVFDDILNAHKSFKDLTFTDDASINEYAGIPVAIVPGSQNNFKITTQEDYERAQDTALSLNKNLHSQHRCGIGYDIHQLQDSTDKTNSIRLGGVDIKFNKKIVAHSDGDVVIHAIIDALLGASFLGDIGEHFPDSDKKWQNANSLDMLKHVSNLLDKKSVTIENIDVTIICQEPKITPYKKDMKQNIAKILKISRDQINIKATTAEKLDAIGRSEAIACHAISSILINNKNT